MHKLTSYTLDQYEPNVKATISFLKQFGIEVNHWTVNETLQNHPDWPSMLCISDSLSEWNIPNAAGKIEQNKIEQLPLPFIANTNNREYPLSVVTKVSDTTIEFYSKNYNRPITENKEDFIKNWTGIYLIAEPNEKSGQKDYMLNKRKALFHDLIPFSLFILVIGLSFFTLYKTVSNAGVITFNTAAVYLHYFLLLAGVVVTALLLWYEIDKNNPLLKKVCTGIAKGNCNAILTGKKSKVFNWLSWSE